MKKPLLLLLVTAITVSCEMEPPYYLQVVEHDEDIYGVIHRERIKYYELNNIRFDADQVANWEEITIERQTYVSGVISLTVSIGEGFDRQQLLFSFFDKNAVIKLESFTESGYEMDACILF